jgi:glycosyltransferase involved in cell wall biosynthesis
MNLAYVLLGNYKLISRAKRQIKALKKEEFDIYLFNGIFNAKDKNEEKENKVEYFNIKQGKSPLLNFIYLILFNLKVSYLILKSNFYEMVICRELSTLLSGYIVKIFNKKIKLVYDSNELSVETHYGIRKKIWKFLESIFIKKCDLIIHAEKYRKKYFNTLYRAQSIKQIVLPNYIEFSNNNIQKNNQVSALYFGSIGPHRNLEELIKVFSQIQNVSLTLMGFGDEKFIQKLNQIALSGDNNTNIKFHPPIDDNEISNIFKNYNIGIAFYPNENLNNWYCAPNKVYQYLQNNMAILTTNNPPLVELIDNYEIGVYVDNITELKIKEALEKIISQKLWLNITENIKKELSWNNIENLFVSHIKSLISNH